MLPQHTTYCEPFAGGASIFFAKPSAGRSILNDLDGDVINVLTCIRDNAEGLIDLLDGLPASKALHAFYKAEYEPITPLQRAFRWYYLNRNLVQRHHAARKLLLGGMATSIPCARRIGPPIYGLFSDKLQGVELSAVDFEDVIDQVPSDTFLFVDPPYFKADQAKFYNCTFGPVDHERLAACLERNSKRIKFLADLR